MKENLIMTRTAESSIFVVAFYEDLLCKEKNVVTKDLTVLHYNIFNQPDLVKSFWEFRAYIVKTE